MALNDKSAGNQGEPQGLQASSPHSLHHGVCNPTRSSVPNDPMASSFVDDPTSSEAGAGAGAGASPHFSCDRDAKRAMRGAAGVIEARPGIIEDTHIDPLSETSNEDDGWANVPGNQDESKASATTQGDSSTLKSAKEMATGAAKAAYETATGKTSHVGEGKAATEGETK
ncbi:hypothetical protein JB92DRAFT_44478 [Gautieria morchelliformis]|nr:hypothetical protein JB92DRAFT_44478 [Gautieria morchelliformis]